MTYRQCPSCGGECKKSGCERADVVKKWVGLTDDERIAILFETDENLDYAKAIEEKLKEKNSV